MKSVGGFILYNKKISAVLIAALMTVSAFSCLNVKAENEKMAYAAVTYESGKNYSAYLSEHKDAHFSQDSIDITTENLILQEKSEDISKSINDKRVAVDKNNSYCDFKFDVSESGFYNIGLNYEPIAESSSTIRLSFNFDNELPYEELDEVSFSRIWVNKYSERVKDENGDEIRDEQTETFHERFDWAENSIGLYEEPYRVYLEKGSHTLKIKRVAESLYISKIVLGRYDSSVQNYETYLESNSSYNDVDKSCIIEAEDAFEKSESTLAATIDSTNAGMSPSDPSRRVVNSFGKDYWQTNGQWASWKVPDDAEAGLYILSFRAKQNGTVGTTTYRTLYINNELPFKEAKSIGFKYDGDWQISTFGDNEPYHIFLKPGDIITLKATTGPMATILSDIYSSVNNLNDIYQSIIMVTSATPDSERDYNIQKEIPDLIDQLSAARKLMSGISEGISNIMGEENPKIFFLQKFVRLIDSFTANPRLIVSELSTFKSYIESYAGETYDFNSLPLELDSIYLMSPASEEPKANCGFFKSLSFEFKRFVSSFSNDYNFTDTSQKAITVWCTLGRDQAQSVKQIIDNSFVPQSGIAVDFKISTTSLTEAILAGCEPDVSISVSQDVPVDLALRGQVLDLTNYLSSQNNEFFEQFSESSWIPFTYKNKIYAMPVTQDFQMVLYRTDILAKLGLSVPTTWNEFYQVLCELQKNNFTVGIRESDSTNAGISTGISFFETLLLQTGDKYFNDDLTEVNFNSTGAKSAFMNWVSLYRDYGLDTDFDLTSRFRSGEMPILITSYSYYQTLATVAPELSGRWTIASMPATVTERGINSTVSSTVSGAIILKSAEKRGLADESFEFLKWWVGSEAQLMYTNAMESLQGIAGRPAVANKSTFMSLGWSDYEKTAILNQWNGVSAIPQVPGTYIINRSLTNALRTSYAGGVDPLRQLSIQTQNINTELARKRLEFENNN